MASGDTFLCQIIGVAGGEYTNVDMHVNLTADSSTNALASAAAVVNQFSTTLKTLWLACFAADYALTGFRARRINPLGGPSAALLTPGAVGAVSGSSVSASVGAGILGPFAEPGHPAGHPVPFWRSAK